MNRGQICAVLVTMGVCSVACAVEMGDGLELNGLLAGSGQYMDLTSDGEAESRGGLPLQLELNYAPTDIDSFSVKFGFASGNGLNGVSPFVLSPWAADLEDDVKNINGRNRDYLLTAWYSHEFILQDANRVAVTLGLIDSSDYLDENTYANDEYTQFMNEAFVNNAQSFWPGYAPGAVMAWDVGRFSFRGVGMNVGENEEGRNYSFGGVQGGFTTDSELGEGNANLLLAATSKDFADPEGSEFERLAAVALSVDQALGPMLGVFVRCAWQQGDAAVTYQEVYSGGFDLKGTAWHRDLDNIGVGYACLCGGNTDVASTHVCEFYYRAVINEYLAITVDAQYLEDRHNEDDDVKGFVCGLRGVAQF